MITPPDSIQPQWVLLDGQPHHVSEFASTPPRKRPVVTCPVCQRIVLLKLGDIRAHHYAHLPDDICRSTQPETALHLNVKYHIYSQLLHAQTIYTEQRCKGWDCIGTRKTIWLQGWNEVRVEHNIDDYRPDIALLQNGKVIGAIEVCVSHKVEEQKAAFFQEQRISWLEIWAKECFYKGDNRWTPDKTLPFIRQFPIFEEWVCEKCQEKQRILERQSLLRQSNPETVISEGKMVDIYYQSGRKYRETYFLKKILLGGECKKAWVNNRNGEIVAQENTPANERAFDRLRQVITNRLNELRQKGVLIDDYMEWRPWIRGQKFVAWDTIRYPFRYSWDESKRIWVKGHSARPNSQSSKFLMEKEPQLYNSAKQGICKYCGTTTTSFDFRSFQYVCANCKDKIPIG